MIDHTVEIARIAGRIVAAARGPYIVQDTLVCPEYDHESVFWPGLARWDIARQRLALVEVLEGSPPNCSCGRKDLEEAPLFISARRVAQVALAATAPAPTCLNPVGHFCERCGSDDLVRAVSVKRDPVLDRYEMHEPLEEEATCLACGWLAKPLVELLSGAARSDQARSARRAREYDEQARQTIGKLAVFLGAQR